MSRYLLGFDIGGTFTDLVLLDADTGQSWVHKVLTTPHDPAQAALDGMQTLLAEQSLRLGDLSVAIHGTTLVTNALIERHGAPTALLTTKGFRDILAMGKEQRYDIYDLFLQFPEPLVPRKWRRPIAERIDRDGNVVTPIDLEQVRSEVAALVAQGVESLAVCFLHAYVNPAHEQVVADLVTREFPSLSLSLSHEVVPEVREYERTATTCANAYVKPLVARYVANLEEALTAGGFRGRFYLMQSSGGTAAPPVASQFPIHLLESGPAAGALAAAFYGKLLDAPNIVSFDMGGTTAKSCLINDGVPTITPMQEAARVHRFQRGSGIPIKAPTIDLIEIGAGGGSIARVSNLGLLKVGPESAGADPGPACYGLGGVEPTVTDANLILGYLNPDYFLGGRMTLDTDAARRALQPLADELELSLTEAAWGIHSIVNENMAAAARVHIVERGHDPRRYTLIAFGGAGPIHASRVAGALEAPAVVLPPAAGATSALGFLIAPISFSFSHSYPTVLDDIDWDTLNQLFDGMAERGTRILAEAGMSSDEIRITRSADMRLVGQFHEINVPVPDGPLGPEHRSALVEAFETQYRRLYSHIYEGNQIMTLTWRATVSGPEPKIAYSQQVAPGKSRPQTANGAYKGTRLAYFPEVRDYLETAVYDRYALQRHDLLQGPAIIEERESTAVIGPNNTARVDEYLNLIIGVGSRAVPRDAGPTGTRTTSLTPVPG